MTPKQKLEYIKNELLTEDAPEHLLNYIIILAEGVSHSSATEALTMIYMDRLKKSIHLSKVQEKDVPKNGEPYPFDPQSALDEFYEQRTPYIEDFKTRETYYDYQHSDGRRYKIFFKGDHAKKKFVLDRVEVKD